MEKRFRLAKYMLLWTIFLVFSSFASLNHGIHDVIRSKAMKHRVHAKETIIETFEMDDLVFDCIDIYKQPAFAHPLFANHTLQMRPTYHPNEGNGYVTEASHPWNLSRSCPQGSIPIQRSLRNGSIKNISSTSHWQRGPQYFSGQRVKQKLLGADTSVHEHSSIQAHESTYYGAKATINVWNPKLETQDESSLAQIWVVSQDRMTTLEAGWMVQPRLYGTDETRFFTYWTSDGYKNGCYNIECPGFVQTNHQTTISSLLRPVSVYGGQQYAIDVEIFKGVQLGYWPKELVPSLANGAGMIYWGGEIAYNQAGAHTSTQMGSGHYSYEGFQKASFFRNVQGMDTSYAYNTPRNFDVKAENGRCYDLQVGGNKDGSWGLFFFYGGPGRSDKCS